MLHNFLAMYNPLRFSAVLLALLDKNYYRGGQFLRRFWTTQNFAKLPSGVTAELSPYQGLLCAGMLVQIISGFVLIGLRYGNNLVAGEFFGLAVIVSYPVVWAHVVALVCVLKRAIYLLLHPKKLGKALVATVLELQVRQLQKKNDFQVVAVVGSVGKTSTKLAIATVLKHSMRVQHQVGNYNDRVTVPLVFFGSPEPSIFNVAAWFKVFLANMRLLRQPYPYDVVVVELGTDGIGFMQEFSYLKIDVAVVSAVTPEHMEYFGTLDAVAKEELTIFDFADKVLVNTDDTPAKYLKDRTYKTYSLATKTANYAATITENGLAGQTIKVDLPAGKELVVSNQNIGKPGAKTTLAAIAVATELQVRPTDIAKVVKQLTPFAGRMQILSGINSSTLIDDTYNATPVAAEAALDALYAAKTSQRIAILGSMNELGEYSREAHKEVGTYCDPQKLDMVVTIGADAERWLAPIRRANCISTAKPTCPASCS